jgi:phage terminase large subunit
MPIQPTTALRKIAGLKKRIWVVRGGQGSAKTISILILLINHASSQPDREILIISAELTKMRLTVIKDFVKVMKMAGIYEEHRFLAGTFYRFRNGSFIKFIGLDKEDVGKGLRSSVAYFNEINKCDRESYRQVSTRAGRIIMDYNPDAEFFVDEDVIPRDDCDFLQLTFEDNELLPTHERDEILNYKTQGYHSDGSIKNSYWANLWQVYGLGNIGNLQGVVFSNWSECDNVPTEAKFVAYGQDFGFTNDPSAMVGVWQKDKELFVKEIMYQTGLLNSDIINQYNAIPVIPSQKVVADSAEPKTIEELRRAGFRVEGAKKGKDSINASIALLQQFNIKVTKDSVNFKKELRSYTWETDVNGKSTNEPIDKNNHAIDALRYVALNYLGARRTVTFY